MNILLILVAKELCSFMFSAKSCCEYIVSEKVDRNFVFLPT